MAKFNDKVMEHARLCNILNDTYEQKNRAYGDSFGLSFKKLGIISAITRISDKYNRLENLALHPEVDKGDESIKDTLLDMANYCLMTYMELDQEEYQANVVKADVDAEWDKLGE